MALVTYELQCNFFFKLYVIFMVFIPCTDNDKSIIIIQQMHILCMYTVTLL